MQNTKKYLLNLVLVGYWRNFTISISHFLPTLLHVDLPSLTKLLVILWGNVQHLLETITNITLIFVSKLCTHSSSFQRVSLPTLSIHTRTTWTYSRSLVQVNIGWIGNACLKILSHQLLLWMINWTSSTPSEQKSPIPTYQKVAEAAHGQVGVQGDPTWLSWALPLLFPSFLWHSHPHNQSFSLTCSMFFGVRSNSRDDINNHYW